MAIKYSNPFVTQDFTKDANKLSQQGKADALSGQPAKGNHTPPKLFLELRSKLKTTYDSAVQACQDEFEEIEKSVDRHRGIFEDSSLKSKSSSLIQQAVLTLNVSKHKVQCLFYKAEFETRKKDLERFRLQHELNFYPERGTAEKTIVGISYAVWVMILLYIVESTMNAALFVNELGPVGGYAVSLSSSLVNVILGFLVGRFVVSRIYLCQNIGQRLFAGLIFLGFLWTIVYMNLMIALYRSLKALENVYADNIPALSSAAWPFPHLSFLDFESSLVVMVGLVFALVALLDGYFADDPFPGYGHKYRLCIKSRDDVQKELEAYKSEFVSASKKTADELEDIFDNAKQAINQWGVDVNRVQRRFVDYKEWTSQLMKGQTSLWTAYCSTHERNRLKDYEVSEVFSKSPEMFVSSKNAIDPSHVFSDVQHLFMHDEARLTLMKSYDSVFTKAHSSAEKALEKELAVLRKEFIKIEKEAECVI